MAWYTDFRNVGSNYPGKTTLVVGVAALACVSSYFIGKSKQRAEIRASPAVSDCEFVQGMMGYETSPALVIHRLDGRSEGAPLINGKFRTLSGMMKDRANWDGQASDYSSQQTPQGKLKPLSVYDLKAPALTAPLNPATAPAATQPYNTPAQPVTPSQPAAPAQPPATPFQSTVPTQPTPADVPITPLPTAPQPPLPTPSGPALSAPAPPEPVGPMENSSNNSGDYSPKMPASPDRTAFNSGSDLERRAEVEFTPARDQVSGLVPIVRPSRNR